MHKTLMAMLVVASFSATAADGYIYPMPKESSRDGEAQCGRLGNNEAGVWYDNWVASGRGAQVSLAQAIDHYSTRAKMDTTNAHNELMASQLKRIYEKKYKSTRESTDDFYAKCLDSDLRKILDKKWVRK